MNEHTDQLLVEPNVLWPTQPKFWVGHGPPCSAPCVYMRNILLQPTKDDDAVDYSGNGGSSKQ